MRHESIPRVVAKWLIPPILLFALYVQFHGDFGPGGGFQAGVIFAAAVVLYTLIFGLQAAKQIVKPRTIETLVALGVLLYAGTGLVSLFLGYNFLDYTALDPESASHGQHLGIFLVELGVGITVAAVMIAIFFSFAGRRRLR